MKVKQLLLIIAVVTALLAAYFTFRPTLRYGTYTDRIDRKVCETADPTAGRTEYNLSLVVHYAFTKPLGNTLENPGPCPYNNYYARTVALELWLIALLVGYRAWKYPGPLRTPRE
jgi:hypothetical protein